MLEDLVEVIENVIIGGRSIAHNEVLRLHLGYFSDSRLVNFGVEGSDKCGCPGIAGIIMPQKETPM